MKSFNSKHRVLEYLMTLVLIFTINFFLPRFMPGDPFLSTGDEYEQPFGANLSEEQANYYRAYYDLDKPLFWQYREYYLKILKGDMGYSISFKNSVLSMITSRLPWTLFMVLTSLLFSCILGTILGCISAWRRNGKGDKFLFLSMIIFSEIPSFLLGLLLLFIFGAKLRWFPLSGGVTPFAEHQSSLNLFVDMLQHAILPIIALTLSRIGGFYLLGRNSMITVLSKDYMRTAKAKGLKKMRIVFVHALKNAILPIITRVFLSLGSMFGGAVLVENVFDYPGVGSLMSAAVTNRDYILLQGIFVFIALSVLTMNLFADIIYKKLDPRVS